MSTPKKSNDAVRGAIIEPAGHDDDWATIGKVVGVFGLHGELKVRLFTDIPNRYTQLETVFIGPKHASHAIEAARPYKNDMVILKLRHVDDVTSAESMRDLDIRIPAGQLAPLPPDFYYQHDILGLEVFTLTGAPVGCIVEIMPTGGNDVYVLRDTNGKQYLIPAVKDVIKQVDLRRKMMYIDPIAGLLDDREAAYSDNEEGEDKDPSVDLT